MMNKCICFDASINKNSKILILGSMPGIRSLKLQEYYAHPQNRFWRIMSDLFNDGIKPQTYQAKLNLLLSHQIALWDVITSCKREGSLDSAITAEQVQDFPLFLANYPNIGCICFNGNKAKQTYIKHVGMIMTERINYIALPSTSPANARWNYDDLLIVWKKALV